MNDDYFHRSVLDRAYDFLSPFFFFLFFSPPFDKRVNYRTPLLLQLYRSRVDICAGVDDVTREIGR